MAYRLESIFLDEARGSAVSAIREFRCASSIPAERASVLFDTAVTRQAIRESHLVRLIGRAREGTPVHKQPSALSDSRAAGWRTVRGRVRFAEEGNMLLFRYLWRSGETAEYSRGIGRTRRQPSSSGTGKSDHPPLQLEGDPGIRRNSPRRWRRRFDVCH